VSFYETAWVIFIYSFLGWCAEVVFAACRRGVFVNRGFLNGPVCPIYGFGVALVLWLLEPVENNFWLLFLGSMVLTTALEFFIGFIMECFFHDKWWDYSKNPFNIKGYVCLEFSLIWGFACVLVVDVLHPMIQKLIDAIPVNLGWWLIWIFAALMAADAIITLVELLKLPKRFKAVEELERMMTAVSDTVGEKVLYEGYDRVKEHREAFDERHPELHEKEQETIKDVLEKRSEINNTLREREDARKERITQYRDELEQRISEVLRHNVIHERIAKAYPHLIEGEHNGTHFRELMERAEKRRLEKKHKG
jgi:uncharacterized membrane protein